MRRPESETAARPDDDREADRRKALAERDAAEPGWRERFAPGSFGCHEALHVAHVLAETVDERLVEHPAVVLRPDWHRLAARASDALHDLYQAVGAAHLDDRRGDGPAGEDQTSQPRPPPAFGPPG